MQRMVTDVRNLSCYIITSHLVCMKSGVMQVSSFFSRLPLFNQFMSFYGFKTCMPRIQVHSHLKCNKEIFMKNVFRFLYVSTFYLPSQSVCSLEMFNLLAHEVQMNECFVKINEHWRKMNDSYVEMNIQEKYKSKEIFTLT